MKCSAFTPYEKKKIIKPTTYLCFFFSLSLVAFIIANIDVAAIFATL